MRFEIVTLFPGMVEAAARVGVVGRAFERGLLTLGVEDPRQHATDVHRTVDDRPYGGGPGMVLKPDVLHAAITAAAARLPAGSPKVALSAAGRPFRQADAVRWAGCEGLLLVAGRYEGCDQRVIDADLDEEVSIGDYVLSGGELAALVIVDAVARLRPGVLGDQASAAQDSFGDGLLDWPHYTRPDDWEGRRVPAVLANGNHAEVQRWRLRQALGRTWQRRPELIARRALSEAERRLLEEYCVEAGIAPPRRAG